ncbi:MAG: hypothetical protein CM1200mP32_12820 [Methanobacteriota archaeon]|nr:MAG: hypothetical protein CM1200mP32_12820 [Euryarchaeota archaeon]
MDAQKVYERRWKILAVMSLSLVITLLNNVTVNVALPELSKDLGADNTELQWIMDAYVVVFGGTLLVMGAFGDRFGRKPALLTGSLWSDSFQRSQPCMPRPQTTSSGRGP